MDTVKVIGPIKGVYHLGFQSVDSLVFRSINEFVNRELAQAMANKMNYDMARSLQKEAL